MQILLFSTVYLVLLSIKLLKVLHTLSVCTQSIYAINGCRNWVFKQNIQAKCMAY